MTLKPGPKPHGYRGTRLYRIWSNMIQRCTNPKNKRFANYGGRGITVCERWRDIRNFAADMGEPPAGASIDRINNDGNYEPSNCRWATTKQQNRNTSRSVMLTLFGETRCVSEWAEVFSVDESRIHARLAAGLSVADALLLPSMANVVAVRGQSLKTGEQRTYLSVRATRADGFSPGVVSHCLTGRQKTHRGWVWRYERAPEDEMLRIAGKPSDIKTPEAA